MWSDFEREVMAKAIVGFAADPALGPRLAAAAHKRLVAEFAMPPGIAQLKRRLSDMLDAGQT